jgi:CBS domain-containing protein
MPRLPDQWVDVATKASMTEERRDRPRLVRDLMKVGVPTCGAELPVAELVLDFLEKNLEAVVVLDSHGHAVGVVTQDELIAVYGDEGVQSQTAEEVMRAGLPQVPPDIPLTAAVQIMRDLGVRVVYMTHHAAGIEYPAAMLSYEHILRHLAAGEADDLRDLGIRAEREPPLETFLRRRDEARCLAGRR